MNAPKARILEADFMTHAFDARFEGILMNAFLNTMPKPRAQEALEKANSLLVPKGIGLASMSAGKNSSGGMHSKKGYAIPVKRYRRDWSRKELGAEIGKRFEVVSMYMDRDPVMEKSWINVLFQKRDES